MGSLFRKKAPREADGDGWSSEPEPTFQRGTVLQSAERDLEQGKLDDAEQGFRKMLGEDNDDIEGLHGLASVFKQKGYRQQAILTYNRLLSLDPGNEAAKQRLGEIMRGGV